MKIAFLITAHKNAEQVARLLRSLDCGRNSCSVHCDSKSGEPFRMAIRAGLAADGISGVRFLPSESVTWGGWGLAGVTLSAMRTLLAQDQDWDYLVNLSGQCFPTRPVAELARFLAQNHGANFMECMDLETDCRRLRHWGRFRYLEWMGRMIITPLPRPVSRPVRIYKGASWFMLSRAFCRHVVEDAGARQIAADFRHARSPEEMVFQTILMNGPFSDTLVRDAKRLIVWDRERDPHPRILTCQDMPRLLSPGHYLARKLDTSVDADIVALLERRCRPSAGLVPPPDLSELAVAS